MEFGDRSESGRESERKASAGSVGERSERRV